MALNLLDLPAGGDGEDDDEGEFCPCAFSDDEEEDHGIDCNCPLCKHGDGGTGDAHEIISKMESEKIRSFSSILIIIGLCLIYFTFKIY